MAILQVQAVLKMLSGIPADSAVNTFHFSTADTLPGTLDAIRDAVRDLYTGVTGLNQKVQDQLSAEVALVGHELKFINLDDPAPRTPIRIDSMTFTSTGAGRLPSEVAICLSFQAVAESGKPQSRRRGRIYVGPLATTTNDNGRPGNNPKDSLAVAGTRLLAASDAAPFWSWIVLSQANPGTPTRPAYPRTFALVDNGWVDNAFDTQRRRGLKLTARSLWT